ncbi:hypothetical protein, partial [uncultured Campylobacter sp.]|uniref:hypothetical protein n=1 Tax=uncultured Campylobacter sp. TaxID=218934 RepID=UPI0026358D0D
MRSKQAESRNFKREQIWLANCGSGVCDGNGAERKFSGKSMYKFRAQISRSARWNLTRKFHDEISGR